MLVYHDATHLTSFNLFPPGYVVFIFLRRLFMPRSYDRFVDADHYPFTFHMRDS